MSINAQKSRYYNRASTPNGGGAADKSKLAKLVKQEDFHDSLHPNLNSCGVKPQPENPPRRQSSKPYGWWRTELGLPDDYPFLVAHEYTPVPEERYWWRKHGFPDDHWLVAHFARAYTPEPPTTEAPAPESCVPQAPNAPDSSTQSRGSKRARDDDDDADAGCETEAERNGKAVKRRRTQSDDEEQTLRTESVGSGSGRKRSREPDEDEPVGDLKRRRVMRATRATAPPSPCPDGEKQQACADAFASASPSGRKRTRESNQDHEPTNEPKRRKIAKASAPRRRDASPAHPSPPTLPPSPLQTAIAPAPTQRQTRSAKPTVLLELDSHGKPSVQSSRAPRNAPKAKAEAAPDSAAEEQDVDKIGEPVPSRKGKAPRQRKTTSSAGVQKKRPSRAKARR